MSDRWFALWFIWLGVVLGWLWRIAHDRHLTVEPLCYVAFLSLALWLWARFDRVRREAKNPAKEAE